MDFPKPNSSQPLSPLTTAVADEAHGHGEEAVVNASFSSSSPTTVKKARTKWRKAEDKPHHPGSGYNFFFQLERERMLLGTDHLPIQPLDVINLQVGGSRVRNAKAASPYQDGLDQTIHPRVFMGEKLGFADLARNIAAKWKNLDVDIKKLFEVKAERERIRYRNELEVCIEQQKKKLLQEIPTSPISQGLQPATPQHDFPPSLFDQQRPAFSHMKHEYQEAQDQVAFRTIPLDNCNAATPNGKSWQHSPHRPSSEEFGENLLWQLTQAKMISPPESTVRATSFNFYPDDSRPTLSAGGATFPKNDLSSKINLFIDEVCTVSEDLHLFAKRGSFNPRLSPQQREIEHQVEYCIAEFRRLSSQVRQYCASQDEMINDQYSMSQRSPMRQANQISTESLRNQYQHVRDVRNILNCSDFHNDITSSICDGDTKSEHSTKETKHKASSALLFMQPNQNNILNADHRENSIGIIHAKVPNNGVVLKCHTKIPPGLTVSYRHLRNMKCQNTGRTIADRWISNESIDESIIECLKQHYNYPDIVFLVKFEGGGYRALLGDEMYEAIRDDFLHYKAPNQRDIQTQTGDANGPSPSHITGNHGSNDGY